jgi:hypothetical protein
MEWLVEVCDYICEETKHTHYKLASLLIGVHRNYVEALHLTCGHPIFHYEGHAHHSLGM